MIAPGGQPGCRFRAEVARVLRVQRLLATGSAVASTTPRRGCRGSQHGAVRAALARRPARAGTPHGAPLRQVADDHDRSGRRSGSICSRPRSCEVARPPKWRSERCSKLTVTTLPGRCSERRVSVCGDWDPEPDLGGGGFRRRTALGHAPHPKAPRARRPSPCGLAFEIVLIGRVIAGAALIRAGGRQLLLSVVRLHPLGSDVERITRAGSRRSRPGAV